MVYSLLCLWDYLLLTGLVFVVFLQIFLQSQLTNYDLKDCEEDFEFRSHKLWKICKLHLLVESLFHDLKEICVTRFETILRNTSWCRSAILNIWCNFLARKLPITHLTQVTIVKEGIAFVYWKWTDEYLRILRIDLLRLRLLVAVKTLQDVCTGIHSPSSQNLLYNFQQFQLMFYWRLRD